MIDHDTIGKLQVLSILEVADKLGIKYSANGAWRKALCFCHDDHTPSLGLNVATNKWKCFACGKGGSQIDLVMEHEQLSFADACEWLVREFNITVSQKENRQSLINALKSNLMKKNNANENSFSVSNYLSSNLLETFKGTSNEFTRALIECGILTKEQMQHAVEVFHLSTIDDAVVFWQIDREGNIREGKVMYYQADGHRSQTRKPVAFSWLLKHDKQLPETWKAKHCLFGLHQIKEDDSRPVAIVESEKTAIICSELLASDGFVWLATGGSNNLNAQALQPLKGKKIIIFPDTDSDGTIYQDWLRIAQEVAEQFGHPITVSNILELHATEAQKKRKIDIADFLLEGE